MIRPKPLSAPPSASQTPTVSCPTIFAGLLPLTSSTRSQSHTSTFVLVLFSRHSAPRSKISRHPRMHHSFVQVEQSDDACACQLRHQDNPQNSYSPSRSSSGCTQCWHLRDLTPSFVYDIRLTRPCFASAIVSRTALRTRYSLRPRQRGRMLPAFHEDGSVFTRFTTAQFASCLRAQRRH